VIKLRSEKADLEKQVVELRARADQIERRSSEQRLAAARKHAEEIQLLKRTNQQLKVL
jgi:dynein light intermediate chain